MLDVCLLADASYPYSVGGTSAWVHELVTGLSTVRFGVVQVGIGREMPREPAFPVPANVERLVDAFPQDPDARPPRRSLVDAVRRIVRGISPERRAAFATLERFYDRLLGGGELSGADAAFEVAAGRGPHPLSIEDLLDSDDAFATFARVYEARAAERPFLEYHRTWRAVQAPIFRILRTPVPAAAIYHAISTSYAGLLGAAAARRTGAPLVITEPGDAAEDRTLPGLDRVTQDAVRDALRRAIYARTTAVLTFTEAARRVEVRRGAPEERCRVVPDGIDVARFQGVRAKTRATVEKEMVLVALVAPVLPEKDVKTFLRAAKLLIERLDLVELIVVGRADLNLPYHRECLLQAQMLGIDRMVRFMGPMESRELFETLDCCILTSLTESAPAVLIEAMAAGVPCVVTDAGGCRELLEGRSSEDRALGPAGVVCPIGDHERIAEAVVKCMRDHAFRDRLVAAGEARATRYYRREQAQALYRELYERLREGQGERIAEIIEAVGR